MESLLTDRRRLVMPKKKKYDDFANVEIDRNYQIPEEFPEGTYGEPVNAEQSLQSQVDNPNRRPYSAFNYENKTLHADAQRNMSNSHPPNDFPAEDTED